MFIAAIFMIAKTRKQSKFLWTDEWIKMYIYFIYTMEFYSAIKMNEIGSLIVMWMHLESVI